MTLSPVRPYYPYACHMGLRFGWYAQASRKPSSFKQPSHRITYRPGPISPVVIQRVAQSVFRTQLTQPGYSHIRVLNVPSPEAFGQLVCQLGEALGKAALGHGGAVLSPVWLSRREFTESTLLHQDMQYHKGIHAPQRLTILGYLPSSVPSRLFVADVAQACRDHGAWSHTLLQQTLNNAAFWKPYTRPVKGMSNSHYDIVVMNDSEVWANSQTQLGVAHYGKMASSGSAASDRVFFQLILRPDPQQPTTWVPIPKTEQALALQGAKTFVGR